MKLFFAIYTEENKVYQHLILHRKSKKDVKEELREKGYTIKGIFSAKDVEKVQAGEFTDITISDKTIAYFEEHMGEWEKAL